MSCLAQGAAAGSVWRELIAGGEAPEANGRADTRAATRCCRDGFASRTSPQPVSLARQSVPHSRAAQRPVTSDAIRGRRAWRAGVGCGGCLISSPGRRAQHSISLGRASPGQHPPTRPHRDHGTLTSAFHRQPAGQPTPACWGENHHTGTPLPSPRDGTIRGWMAGWMDGEARSPRTSRAHTEGRRDWGLAGKLGGRVSHASLVSSAACFSCPRRRHVSGPKGNRPWPRRHQGAGTAHSTARRAEEEAGGGVEPRGCRVWRMRCRT